MEEEWRPIAETNNTYFVSNQGRVKSPSGKILSHSITPDGYHDVSIKVGSRCMLRKVHRLVGAAFLPDYAPYPEKEVNHIDGNKDNNCLDNIEMVSHQENVAHYWKSEVFSEQRQRYSEYARDAMTNRWKDSEFRDKVQAVFNSPEYKEAHSKAAKAVYDDPSMRQKASERSKKMWADDSFHCRQIQAIKDGWADSAKRKAASKRLAGLIWLTAPDGSYCRCHPDELDEKISLGYVKGRKGSDLGGKLKVHCGKTGKIYSSMTECENELGLKHGDAHAILKGHMPKRLIPVQQELQLSLYTGDDNNI